MANDIHPTLLLYPRVAFTLRQQCSPGDRTKQGRSSVLCEAPNAMQNWFDCSSAGRTTVRTHAVHFAVVLPRGKVTFE